jgi:hypothetical protein
LYILDINPLSIELLVKIFFHFVGYLLIVVIVPFDVQRFLVPCNSIRQSLLLFHGLLVRMQTVASSMEITMEVYQKAKNRPTLWPSYTTLGHISEGV